MQQFSRDVLFNCLFVGRVGMEQMYRDAPSTKHKKKFLFLEKEGLSLLSEQRIVEKTTY